MSCQHPYDAMGGYLKRTLTARAYHPSLGRFMSEDPKLFDAGDYNLFRYCHNDPIDFTDPTGEIIDTLLDIGFIAYDVYKVATDSANRSEHLTALGLDSAAAVIPGVTGAGAVYRGARAVERTKEVGRTAREIKKVSEAATRTKTDRLLEHVTPKDLSAAAREARTGEQFRGQHLKELREAAEGLRERIKDINQGLSNPRLGSEERKALERELGRASRGLDAAERLLTPGTNEAPRKVGELERGGGGG